MRPSRSKRARHAACMLLQSACRNADQLPLLGVSDLKWRKVRRRNSPAGHRRNFLVNECLRGTCRGVIATRGLLRNGLLLESEPAIQRKRNSPAQEEDADDQITEICKILAEIGDPLPKAAFQL